MEKSYNYTLKLFFVFMIIGILLGGCAKSPYLKVRYQLSEKTDILAGKELFVEIKDMRTEKAILGKEAKAYFKRPANRFSLFLAEGEKDKAQLGLFDPPSLFKEAFKQRMEHIGVKVSEVKEKGLPTIIVELEKFSLDLMNNKWISKAAYTARAMSDTGFLFSESVNGTAERQKILGRKDAEKVLGEVLTDSVNKLDIRRLLQ